MNAFLIVPLSIDSETLETLDKSIETLSLKSVFPTDDPSFPVRLVQFKGTPAELSKKISETLEEEIHRLVVSINLIGVAGWASSDLVQWIQEYAE
ncbi:MAG: hypothetical protein F4X69_02630 [Gemmatimonadetes bacterium]|nr:hypothetical protein [Gemmatimonadota bacterium]